MEQTDVTEKKQTTGDFFSGTGSILKTLGYFDIFHYPLTREEIKTFLSAAADDDLFDQWLAELTTERSIYYFNGFYSLHNNPLLAYRRKQGNERAAGLLIKGNRIGRFLYQFPFVRAVGISGSLSKNFADEKADIDFFVITKTGRLWIARTLMHLFKKLTFFTGQQHFFCMNYYIDEKSLLLNQQNIFTAIEVKTLLPVSGEKTMQHFFTANQWAGKWLPGCSFRPQEKKDPSITWLKKLVEWMFSNKAGNLAEHYLFRLTEKRWSRKIKKEKRNDKGARMALITGKHFARSNPDDFQEKVLALYQQKLSAIRKNYQATAAISSAR